MTSVSQREQDEERGECVSAIGGETTTASSGHAGGVLRIIMACRVFFDSLKPPLGYEDETGFHYGSEPENE